MTVVARRQGVLDGESTQHREVLVNMHTTAVVDAVLYCCVIPVATFGPSAAACVSSSDDMAAVRSNRYT